MFIAVIFIIYIMIFARIKVLALHPEDKLNTDVAENMAIYAFLSDDDTIRLNITLGINLDGDTTVYILVQNNDDEGCFYTYEDITFLSNNTLTVPNLVISDPVDQIILGCSYSINVTIEQHTFNYLYHVPDCIGSYCVCVTNETNFIKLVAVEHVQNDVYSVLYVSQNTSLEKGNFYITGVSYESGDQIFEVPEVKYNKGSFEIRMKYLNKGENNTLFVNYRDSDNLNPDCIYIANLMFVADIHPSIEAEVPSKTDSYIILKIVVSLLLFLSASAMLFCFLKRSKYYSMTVEEFKICIFPPEHVSRVTTLSTSTFRCPHQEVNTLYTPLEMTLTKTDSYEFPRENLIIKDVIGEGAFGKVFYAKAYNLNGLPGYTMVAVKQLRAGAPKEDLADFQAEIKMLKKIGVHKNIVKLLACVTKNEPLMMIMELVSTGDLKEYLLKLREIWIKNKNKRRFFPDDMEEQDIKSKESQSDTIINEENSDETPNLPPRVPRTPDFISKLLLSEGISTFDVDTQTPLLSDIGGRPDPVLDHRELENFALQIASGMEYLEKIPVTHRDLAARNILITKEKVLKISDFGMSRTGPYVNRSRKKIPLRWMAIEAIDDFKTDSKSDVWSFGVVLWEIGTLGAFPYEDVPNELLLKELKEGRRLPRPEICTDELYELMQKCWLESPALRPSFAEMVEHLNLKKKHAYVDFSQVNPKYVFPPTDREYERDVHELLIQD